ncbi:unnamed protein product [Adineta steineri]|uniref:Uncharacterized protein n=1 Tax=Adineta steineri TaxID=433720 RepID=A0A819KEH5_9BILA|nr:unnamed protein product [Adineta steineri]
MHFIYGVPVCPPICPPLSNDEFVSSSEENLNERSNFLINQKLNTYAKQFGRHFIFSSSRPKENIYNEKDIDEEFDQISLSDNCYNTQGKSENSPNEPSNTKQNSPLIDTDGLSVTARNLSGINNLTNNQNNTITDDGMVKTTNGGINNGKYVGYI